MSEACLFQLEQNLRALNLTNAVKGHPDSRTKGTPISPQVYAFHRD